MKLKCSLLALLLCVYTGSVRAQDGDFVVVGVKIDKTREAKSIFTTADECMRNSMCETVLKAASAYAGVPADKVVAVAALLSSTPQGEGTESNIHLPSGYSYCRATISLVSIVPHDGSRGSTLLARADAAKLNIQTWTPVLPLGQGRSWVEANISLVGVRDYLAEQSYSSGKCVRPESRIFLYCRGGGCESPKNTVDSGQSVDPSTAPNANSRK